MASNERFYLEAELVLGLILNILELPLSTSMVSWNVSSVLVVVSLSLSWKRMFYPVFIPSWTIKRSVRSNQGRSDCFFGSVGCWTMIMEIIHYQKNNLVPQTRMLLLKYRIQIKSNHEIALYKILHLKLLFKVILVTLWDVVMRDLMAIFRCSWHKWSAIFQVLGYIRIFLSPTSVSIMRGIENKKNLVCKF